MITKFSTIKSIFICFLVIIQPVLLLSLMSSYNNNEKLLLNLIVSTYEVREFNIINNDINDGYLQSMNNYGYKDKDSFKIAFDNAKKTTNVNLENFKKNNNNSYLLAVIIVFMFFNWFLSILLYNHFTDLKQLIVNKFKF